MLHKRDKGTYFILNVISNALNEKIRNSKAFSSMAFIFYFLLLLFLVQYLADAQYNNSAIFGGGSMLAQVQLSGPLPIGISKRPIT